MKHKYNEVLEKGMTIISNYENCDTDDNVAFEEWDDFIKAGTDSLTAIRDVIFEHFMNEFNTSAVPKNFDYLMAFLGAAAREMQGDDTDKEVSFIPLEKVVNECFNGDELLLNIIKKYDRDDYIWHNVQLNSWKSEGLYYAIIKECVLINKHFDTLISELLNASNHDIVCEISTNAYPDSFLKGDDNSYFVTSSTITYCLAKIWCLFIDKPDYINRIILDSVFDEDLYKKTGIKKFDKVSASINFGNTLKTDTTAKNYLVSIQEEFPEITNVNSADLMYAYRLSTILEQDGSGTVVVSNGSLINKRDQAIRKLLIKKQMIKAVIHLPEHFRIETNVYAKKSLSSSILILGHNNDAIKLIDVAAIIPESIADRLNRGFSLNDSDSSQIVEMILDVYRTQETDCSYCKVVTLDDLEDADYVLSLNRYSSKYDLINNGVCLGKTIKSIRRGISISANELELLKSPVKTNYYYLMGSDISDGVLIDELPSIKQLDMKQEKYCLKNGNMVITKNGTPHKIAVIEADENVRILASDNCYVIDVDQEIIDPYYLLAYLTSDKGETTLERITVGTNIKTIGISDLKEMLIPCPPKSEQKRVSEKYQEKLKELQLLKFRAAKIRESLTDIFDDEDE